MNEWGLIGERTIVALVKFATIYNFKQRCGSVLEGRTVLSNPHASYPSR